MRLLVAGHALGKDVLALHFPHALAEAAQSLAREEVGEEAFAEVWAEGQAMTLEQAVEYALKDDHEA